MTHAEVVERCKSAHNNLIFLRDSTGLTEQGVGELQLVHFFITGESVNFDKIEKIDKVYNIE